MEQRQTEVMKDRQTRQIDRQNIKTNKQQRDGPIDKMTEQ